MAPAVTEELPTGSSRQVHGVEHQDSMKAITYDKYGSFDLLAYKDIAIPVIKDHELLIRVHAAALHVGDCFSVRGAPFLIRTVTGLHKPKYGVPGFDLAGRVEAVGTGVKRFRPGDEVFGASSGTCVAITLSVNIASTASAEVTGFCVGIAPE